MQKLCCVRTRQQYSASWDYFITAYHHISINSQPFLVGIVSDGEPPWSYVPDERSSFDPNFEEFCDYTLRAIQTLSILDDSSSTLAPCPTFMANQHDFKTYQHAVNHDAPDYEKFRPVKQAQVFVVRDTLVADAYPMISGKQFINTLENNIRRWGAMDKPLSYSAKTQIFNKVMDILRAYHISNLDSEPYHQNQNPAEWRYRTIKSWTNTVMKRSGAPTNCWLLCLIYVCYLLNHIACTALDGKFF